MYVFPDHNWSTCERTPRVNEREKKKIAARLKQRQPKLVSLILARHPDGSRGGAGHHLESGQVAGGGGCSAPASLAEPFTGGQRWLVAPSFSPPPKLKSTGNDEPEGAPGAVTTGR